MIDYLNKVSYLSNSNLGTAISSITTDPTSDSDFKAILEEETAKTTTTTISDIIKKASNTYGISEEIIKAVAQAESNFNANAVSSSGAQGVMQLMPATAASLGVTNSFDAEQNIMGGTKYLSSMLEKYDGDLTLALAAYNAGPGNVDKYGGIPPFNETQNYVKKITTNLANGGVSIPSSANSVITTLATTADASSIVAAPIDVSELTENELLIKELQNQIASQAETQNQLKDLILVMIQNNMQQSMMNLTASVSDTFSSMMGDSSDSTSSDYLSTLLGSSSTSYNSLLGTSMNQTNDYSTGQSLYSNDEVALLNMYNSIYTNNYNIGSMI